MGVIHNGFYSNRWNPPILLGIRYFPWLDEIWIYIRPNFNNFTNEKSFFNHYQVSKMITYEFSTNFHFDTLFSNSIRDSAF